MLAINISIPASFLRFVVSSITLIGVWTGVVVKGALRNWLCLCQNGDWWLFIWHLLFMSVLITRPKLAFLFEVKGGTFLKLCRFGCGDIDINIVNFQLWLVQYFTLIDSGGRLLRISCWVPNAWLFLCGEALIVWSLFVLILVNDLIFYVFILIKLQILNIVLISSLSWLSYWNRSPHVLKSI